VPAAGYGCGAVSAALSLESCDASTTWARSYSPGLLPRDFRAASRSSRDSAADSGFFSPRAGLPPAGRDGSGSHAARSPSRGRQDVGRGRSCARRQLGDPRRPMMASSIIPFPKGLLPRFKWEPLGRESPALLWPRSLDLWNGFCEFILIRASLEP
jgi:hypothetical protein